MCGRVRWGEAIEGVVQVRVWVSVGVGGERSISSVGD